MAPPGYFGGSVSKFAGLQSGCTMQMFPILCAGLYLRDPKPVPLFWGGVVGSAVFLYLFFADDAHHLYGVLPGIWGFLANVLVWGLLHAVDEWAPPALQPRFLRHEGEGSKPALSYERIVAIVAHVDEPVRMWHGCLLPVTAVLALLGFPFVRQAIFTMECMPEIEEGGIPFDQNFKTDCLVNGI